MCLLSSAAVPVVAPEAQVARGELGRIAEQVTNVVITPVEQVLVQFDNQPGGRIVERRSYRTVPVLVAARSSWAKLALPPILLA